MKSFQVIVLGLLVLSEVEGFVLDHSNRNARLPISSLAASRPSSDNSPNENARRQALDRLVTFTGVAAASLLLAPSSASAADSATTSTVEKEGKMYSPKFVQSYDDFKESPEGWSYREVTAGKGDSAAKGDRVVFDWVSCVGLRCIAIRVGSFGSCIGNTTYYYICSHPCFVISLNTHFVFRRVGKLGYVTLQHDTCRLVR
jgi:hypothetical protein